MEFFYQFEIDTPIEAVAALHRSPSILTKLTPPPLRMEIRSAPPLAEGVIVEFTLRLGPFRIPWTAYHTAVHSLHGFTDTQIEGPLAVWIHRHTFTSLDDRRGPRTRISDRLEIIHRGGLGSLWTRLFFSPPMLWMLFTYRRLAIQKALRQPKAAWRSAG